MPSATIRDETTRKGWISVMEAQQLPFTASFTKGAKRTDQQNKTIHLWYAQASSELGDTTVFEVKAQCKLYLGVPILCRDDVDFREKYYTLFKPLSVERKLKLFELLDPAVTSIMTIPQLTEYMKQMQMFFANTGITLIEPNPDKRR